MRRALLTAATIIGIYAAPTVAGAQAVIAADTVIDTAPGVVVATPPAVGGAVIVRDPYAYDRVYVAPEAYAYYDAGPRGYYQDCWWEWDHRICRLKPRW